MAEDLRRKFSIDEEVDLDSVLTSSIQNSMQHNVFIRGKLNHDKIRVTTSLTIYPK